MQKMKRTEFTALMSKLRACYQNGVRDQSLWLSSLSTYWSLMQEFDADDIRAAFAVAWRRYPDWMPSCGQLVALLDDPTSKAAAAWPEVMRLASRSSGDHTDPLAAEAIHAMGGGGRLGRMTTAELESWGHREFIEQYITAHKRAQARAAIRRLGAADGAKSDAGAEPGPNHRAPPEIASEGL